MTLEFRILFAYNSCWTMEVPPRACRGVPQWPAHCLKEGRMPNHSSLQQTAKALGVRIRQLRKKKGWTQDKFAVICNIHRSHMGKIERGETNLRLSTLVVIAKNLDVRMEELLAAAEGRRWNSS